MDWNAAKDVVNAYYIGNMPAGYVRDCTLADWEKLFDFLRSGDWKYQYLYDVGHYDVPEPLPWRPIELIRANADGSCRAMLRVWPDPELSVWFWALKETRVAFDLTLPEPMDQSRLDIVCTFLSTLGRLLGKPVYFGDHDIDEEERPVLWFDPATDQVGLVSVAAG